MKYQIQGVEFNSMQCIGEIKCGLSLVQQNHTTLETDDDGRRQPKCRWPTNGPYFESYTGRHPDSSLCMLRNIRNNLITLIITGSIDHFVQTKDNFDCLVGNRSKQLCNCTVCIFQQQLPFHTGRFPHNGYLTCFVSLEEENFWTAVANTDLLGHSF